MIQTTKNVTNKIATDTTVVFSKRVRRMLGLSLHGWENWMVGSLIVAAIFALIAGFSTWAVVKLQRQEISASKEDFDRYKLDTEEKIADSTARTREAELALEKYKQPRSLDIDSFLERLKGVPSRKVQVLYVRECSDCSWVAQFIGSFLNTANWEAAWAPIDEKAAAAGPWRMQPSAISVRGYPWGITVVAKKILQDYLTRAVGVPVLAATEAVKVLG